MSDNVFEIFSRYTRRDVGEDGRMEYTAFATDNNSEPKEAIRFYFADRSTVVLFYDHLSEIVAPSEDTLIFVGKHLAVRVDGCHLHEMLAWLRCRQVSAMGCWDETEFLPVQEGETVIHRMTRLSLQSLLDSGLLWN